MGRSKKQGGAGRSKAATKRKSRTNSAPKVPGMTADAQRAAESSSAASKGNGVAMPPGSPPAGPVAEPATGPTTEPASPAMLEGAASAAAVKALSGETDVGTHPSPTAPDSSAEVAAPEGPPAAPTPGPRVLSFGRRVKARMQEIGLAQTDLARKTEIERSELNRILNDRREPDLLEIVWIAGALDVAPESLVDEESPEIRRRAIREVENSVKRVLRAEGERDEAREELRELERAIAEERRTRAVELHELTQRHEQERLQLMVQIRNLEKGLRESRDELAREKERHAETAKQLYQDAEARIWEVQVAAHQAEVTLRAHINEQKQALDLRTLELRRSEARNQAQSQQIQVLQAQMAKESDKKVAATALTGLAGLFFGAALASSDGKRRR